MRALVSVFDKAGLVDFARTLVGVGFELVSTGGSAKTLLDAGLEVTPVEQVTGYPEILNGRVKTLHPAIHGGLLARMDVSEHVATLADHDIVPIDLLVSNLYPFEQAVQDPSLDIQQKVEQIDIGGPAMVRAAAKNYASVVVVTDPGDYERIGNLLASDGVDLQVRRRLAAKAFEHVSTYDSLVAEFLREEDSAFPDELAVGLRKSGDLRYGENPQQAAAAYSLLAVGQPLSGLLNSTQLHGKELSFNNLMDADAAWQASSISSEPTVSIVKHTVPCGLATRNTIEAAFTHALEGDIVSAFGGIVSLNRPVDETIARMLAGVFFEVIIAPEFTQDALQVLTKKKNLRLLQLAAPARGPETGQRRDYRPITGGMLVQSADDVVDNPGAWRVVTDT
ncbi:MAG: bifunctional phosphoribosylaminoimidazolecarboxamide formyltransferase/IMP cyclohydrolase, partial [Chloroflexia bacterium]|nr:bifunctional phosphoribosylaminoimidazolecarboxamide formyltransferase/IMP cyclohydrolase [Chloroflexia bacterium]